MSKTPKIIAKDFEKSIMAKVRSNEISIRPRWYFVLGSFLTVTGLAGLTIGAIFLFNVTLFLLRKHGPMGQWRFQSIIYSFPWWVPILAVFSIAAGIWILRRYDFSYKKSFWLIIIGFIFSVILGASILDFLGLNEIWSRQGPMRRFYQKVENQNQLFPKGQGQRQGRIQNP